MAFWRPGAQKPAPVAAEDHGPELDPPAVDLHVDAGKSTTQRNWGTRFLWLLESNSTVLAWNSQPHVALNDVAALIQTVHGAGWTSPPRRICVVHSSARSVASCASVLRKTIGVNDSISFVEVATNIDQAADLKDHRVLVSTYDVFLRVMMFDPLLLRTSLVLLSDFCDRRVGGDLILALLRRLQKRREHDLRVVVHVTRRESIDALRRFCGTAERPCPVLALHEAAAPSNFDVLYLQQPTNDYFGAARRVAIDLGKEAREAGRLKSFHLLVFVTAVDEVAALCEALEQDFRREGLGDVLVAKLFGSLRDTERLHAVAPPSELFRNTGKVVVATSVAESTVSVRDVTHVVDVGFTKRLLSKAGVNKMETFSVVPISKAVARVRASSASRKDSAAKGQCIRLYTEHDYMALPDQDAPEILYADLTRLVLQMKALGIGNIMNFRLPTSPREENVAQALESLQLLDIIDGQTGELTDPVGKRIGDLPSIEPQMARSLLAAEELDCVEEVASIAAVLHVIGGQSGDKLFASDSAKSPFAVAEGDFMTFMNVHQAFVSRGRRSEQWCQKKGLNFRLLRSIDRLCGMLRRGWAGAGGGKAGDGRKEDRILRAIMRGYFQNAAVVEADGSYRPLWRSSAVARGSGVEVATIHPGSVLHRRFPKVVVYSKIVQTHAAAHMLHVSVIEPEWLVEDVPSVFAKAG